MLGDLKISVDITWQGAKYQAFIQATIFGSFRFLPLEVIKLFILQANLVFYRLCDSVSDIHWIQYLSGSTFHIFSHFLKKSSFLSHKWRKLFERIVTGNFIDSGSGPGSTRGKLNEDPCGSETLCTRNFGFSYLQSLYIFYFQLMRR